MFLAACVEDENVPVIQAKELTPGGVPVPLGHREREGEGERGGERERGRRTKLLEKDGQLEQRRVYLERTYS